MTAPTKAPEKPGAATESRAKRGMAADGDAESGKGGKTKLLILLVVALLAIGAGLYFFVFSGSEDTEEVEEPVAGEVLALDAVTVNLAGSGYLKVGVTLQLTEDVGDETPDGSLATDIIIDMFSEAQPTDVTGNRDAMKAELEQRIEDAYNTDDLEYDVVMGIYYTEYVTQ